MSVNPQVELGTASLAGKNGDNSRVAFTKFNAHNHTEYASKAAWSESVATLAELVNLPGSNQTDGRIVLVRNSGTPLLFAFSYSSTGAELPGFSYVPIDNIGRWKRIISAATIETPGLVRPDGTSITITPDGIISAADGTPTATVSNLGKVRPDGSSIGILNGILSAISYPATNTILGHVKPDNTTIGVSLGGTLTANDYPATTANRGHVKPDGSTIAIDNTGTIKVADDTSLKTLTLNNPTTPAVFFNPGSYGGPSINTRSPGSRVILDKTLGTNTTDVGLGVENNALWLGTSANNKQIKFYHGLNSSLILGQPDSSLSGNLTIAGNLNLGTALPVSSGGTGRNNLILVGQDLSYVETTNFVLNNCYQDWSRIVTTGTTTNITNPLSGQYYASRMVFYSGINPSNGVLSRRMFSYADPAPIPSPGVLQAKHYYRWLNNDNNYSGHGPTFEAVENFSAQTFTLSVYVRSSLASTAKLLYYAGFGQGPNASPFVLQKSPEMVTGTAWTRLIWTFTTESFVSKTYGTGDSGFRCSLETPINKPGVAYDMWGWQLEEGTVATKLKIPHPTDNAMRCKRYFFPWALTYNDVTTYATTDVRIPVPYPVPMFRAPIRKYQMKVGTSLNVTIFYPEEQQLFTGLGFVGDTNHIGGSFFMRAGASGYFGLFDYVFGMDSELYF